MYYYCFVQYLLIIINKKTQGGYSLARLNICISHVHHTHKYYIHLYMNVDIYLYTYIHTYVGVIVVTLLLST